MKRAQAKMTEDLARSTIPVEDLKNVGKVSAKSRAKSPGYLGLYEKNMGGGGTAKISVVPAKRQPMEMDPDPEYNANIRPQRGPQNEEDTLTLLHELGHHASLQSGNPQSEYHTPEQQGKEEATADIYAVRHYREDVRGRGWDRMTPYEARESTYQGKRVSYGKSKEWQGGYKLPRGDLPPRIKTSSSGWEEREEEEQRPQLPDMEKVQAPRSHYGYQPRQYEEAVRRTSRAQWRTTRGAIQERNARWNPHSRLNRTQFAQQNPDWMEETWQREMTPYKEEL